MIAAVRLHTVAWGALWFFVVVAFTAGVGVIQAAGSAGQMPPLTSTVEGVVSDVADDTVVGDVADDPSSAPEPPTVGVARSN
jgi:hypothetical protein